MAASGFSLQAGVNDPEDPNIAVLAFLPQSVTVTAGSTVDWKIAGPEPAPSPTPSPSSRPPGKAPEV